MLLLILIIIFILLLDALPPPLPPPLLPFIVLMNTSSLSHSEGSRKGGPRVSFETSLPLMGL
eukprot:7945968-Pyramimonas_sp.AAC.1